MPTMADIAALSGVSIPTVAKVINGTCGTTRVGEDTKKRILDFARRIGYQKHTAASHLVTGRSNAVGVVISRFGSPFYGKLLNEISSLLAKENLMMVPLVIDSFDESLEDLSERFFFQRLIDGLIYLEHDLSNEHAVSLAKNFPIVERVWLGSRLSVPRVSIDYESSINQLMRIFKEKGKTNVGLLIEQRDKESLNKGNSKVRLCLDSMVEQGFVFRENQWCIVSGPTRTEVLMDTYQQARNLVRENKSIDALIIDSGELAVPVYRALQEEGLVIGKDILIAGWTDTPELLLMNPPMAVMTEPFREVAENLVGILLQQMDRSEETNIIPKSMVSSKLEIRESLGV